MQKLYLAVFTLFTIALTAQESPDFQYHTSTEPSEVKLYPNPASGGMVHILTRANTNKNIVVYDVFGEVVLIDKIAGKTLNISRLSPGVYVLQVSEGRKNFTRKLVVK